MFSEDVWARTKIEETNKERKRETVAVQVAVKAELDKQ